MDEYAIFIDGRWVHIDQQVLDPHAYSTVEGNDEHVVWHAAWVTRDTVEKMSPQQRTARKIFKITAADPVADGLIITGRTIINAVGDRPQWFLTTAEKTVEQARLERRSELDMVYLTKRETPMPWNFGEIPGKNDKGHVTGPAGAQTLQMRRAEPNNDIANWQGAALNASILASVAPDEIVPLKTTDNIWVQTTAAQALQVLALGDGNQSSVFSTQLQYLERYGALKTAIADASTVAQVEAIDLGAGWP